MPVNLSEWVELYTGDLLSWAQHKVSDAELARDLVQDTFLAAAEKVGSFKGDSSPKTWLFSILNHKIIDVYRKKIKHPTPGHPNTLSDYFDPEGNWYSNRKPRDWQNEQPHLLDDLGFQIVLKNCLNALPEKWKMCVQLKYLSEKRGEEICQELELTPTNLWQIVHRAKLQLRDCVEKNWFKN